MLGSKRRGAVQRLGLLEGLGNLGHWRMLKADVELWGFKCEVQRTRSEQIGSLGGRGRQLMAERAWSPSKDLWCGAGSVGRLWSAGRRPCALVVSHLRAPSVPTSPAFQAPSCPLLSSPMGSVRSRSAGAVPAQLYKAPAGPFGKRISFFLDAFPDLGIMEGLRAARAWARLREEELGSSGPQPRAGNQSTPSQALDRDPLGQPHNLRLGPPDYILLPQIPSETVCSRKGRARGGGR